METFTSVLEFLTYWLVDQYWFPVFLIGSGIFFTVYLGFPQIKYFRHGWRILSGRYVKEDTKGETTPFQAEKELAHRYLNYVLNALEEYRG